MNPPGAIPHQQRARPRRSARRPFQLEALEPRNLPAASLTGIIATTPADGSSVVQAPPSLTIAFDPSVVAQIDAAFSDFFGGPPDQTLPGFFAFDGGQEVEIDRIGANGSTTPIFGTPKTPAVAQSLTATTAADGTVQAQLVVALPTGTEAPGPGTYQVDLLQSTYLASVFAAIEPTSAWATATDPIPVAQFTVTGQGPTLAAATDLGTIGAQTTTAAGSLDPGYYQSADALYRFELPQGTTWQLDAQILASAIGSPVQGALALFDASGQVLATRNTGSGSSGNRIDPGLFQDLPGGTYYLGVSSAGDLPGTTTGYDPITGLPGTGGLVEPAGPFRLSVSAAPVVATTALTSFALEHADPALTSPTALDLSFSGPLDLSPLQLPDQQQTALQVVGAGGRIWPITLAAAPSDQLRFLFDEPLPPGSYSLIVPAQAALSDPGGRPVVGPSAATPEILATWTVAPRSTPADPTDLGVLWPGPVNVTWNAQVSGTTNLVSGQTIDDHFIVIYSGWYSLSTPTVDGTVDIEIATGDGTTIPSNGSPPIYYLTPGSYQLRFTDLGAGPAQVLWTLTPPKFDHEDFVLNGVGQVPALSLPFLGSAPGPLASSVDGPEASLPSPSPTPTATTATPSGSFSTSTATAPAYPISVAGLLVSLDASPAGSPASGPGPGTATATMSDGVSSSLADSGRVAMARLLARSSSGTDPRVGDATESDPEPTPAVAGPVRAANPTADDPATASARADAIALSNAREEPMARLAGWIARRASGGPTDPNELQIAPTDLNETLLAAVDVGDRDRGRANLARADLGVPFAVLIGTAVSYRLARPIGKWWRRHPGQPISLGRPHRFESTRVRI